MRSSSDLRELARLFRRLADQRSVASWPGMHAANGCWDQSRHDFRAPAGWDAQAPSTLGQQQWRGYAKKKAASAPAPKPTAPAPALTDDRLKSPLSFLKMRKTKHDSKPISLIPEDEQQALKEVMPKRLNPDGSEQDTDLESFKQVGVPLSRLDTARLMHDSMLHTVGEQVQMRHFVFSNVFQSAESLAQYVANALETGMPWTRIERFLLSTVETDPNLAAIKVQVKGRLGRGGGADKKSMKVWMRGSFRLRELMEPVDSAKAVALTRMGILGVKVYLRFHREAAQPAIMPRGPPKVDLEMTDILAIPRTPLPTSATAWWSKSGLQQPLANRTWRALVSDYSPTVPVSEYLAATTPVTFKSESEREAYVRRAFGQAGDAEAKSEDASAQRSASDSV